jgi:hypothetical protein
VKIETVSFEKLDGEKRLERAHGTERLRTGAITPEALHEENSISPNTAKELLSQ